MKGWQAKLIYGIGSGDDQLYPYPSGDFLLQLPTPVPLLTVPCIGDLAYTHVIMGLGE
jgi:hypothetical protein